MLSSARNRYLLHRAGRAVRQLVESQRELMKRWRFRPAQAGIEFGEDADLPPLSLKTPGGSEVRLRGKIDRIDALPEGSDAVALDYRLGIGPLSLAGAYHGLSLQLLAHLLVLQTHGAAIAGRDLKPAAAFYVQLLRSHGEVEHPDEALDPADPKFLLALKPRGVFDGSSLAKLDSEVSDGRSLAISAFVKKNGGFGYKGSTDVTEGEEFPALLKHAAHCIGELADRILANDVAIAPYRLNQQSPCARCDYRSICRFETTVNRYRILEPLGREQVLQTLAGAKA
jgi:ATP-dependent helicase/nuclease subunit B